MVIIIYYKLFAVLMIGHVQMLPISSIELKRKSAFGTATPMADDRSRKRSLVHVEERFNLLN